MKIKKIMSNIYAITIKHMDGKMENLYLGQELHLAHEGECKPEGGCLTSKIKKIKVRIRGKDRDSIKIICDDVIVKENYLTILSIDRR